MSTQLLLKEKRALMKNELSADLQKKHALELQISRLLQELKKLEISLEKCTLITATQE